MSNRFSRILLLLRTLLSLAVRGRAQGSVSNPKRIVIIQPSKLGDMVCTTPMFRAIKKIYPECMVTVAGDHINKELLVGHKDVDQYIVWDKRDPASLIAELRKAQYDFGCITAPNFEGLAALLLSGIPVVAAPEVVGGWSPYETRPYRSLRKFVIAKPHRMGAYAPREYLRLLEPLGISESDTTKSLFHSHMASDKIGKFLEENKLKEGLFAGIMATAGNKIKEWPEDRFAEVADHLIEKYGAKIMIIGGPKDRDRVDKVASLMRNEAWRKCDLSIDELKALISKLSLLIAVDTGPIYIAEAYGIPTVDIVGPMDENEQPPISEWHKVVVPPLRSKPELHIMNARSYDEAKAIEQVLSITTGEVVAAVDELVGRIQP